jgi:hypothetical protein
MPDDLTDEEAKQFAGRVARRLLTTPPQPRKAAKPKGKPAANPTRARASSAGKRGQAGAAS